MGGSRAQFPVTEEEAQQILRDATEQRANRLLPRGERNAFGYLIRALQQATQAPPAMPDAKGSSTPWADPGMETARTRMSESPAQFLPGQKVRYWSEWNDDPDDGMLLEIVESFGLSHVSSDGGEYIDDKGARHSYRYGYIARTRLGKELFFPAYNLRDADSKLSYLKLVPRLEKATA